MCNNIDTVPYETFLVLLCISWLRFLGLQPRNTRKHTKQDTRPFDFMVRPDEKLIPELRAKFLRFREVYEATRTRFTEEGASGAVIATYAWQIALRTVPLAPKNSNSTKPASPCTASTAGNCFSREPNLPF